MGERTIPVPLLSPLPNDLRLASEGGLTRNLRESWGGRCAPRPAGSHHMQQQPDSMPTSTLPRGGETDALEYSGPKGLHSLSNLGMRDVGPLLESPPNLLLDRLPGQLSGVLRPIGTSKGKRAKLTMGFGEAAHARKSTRKSRDSIVQVSL